MESFPVIAALIILTAVYKKFKLTDLNYWMILLHCIILLIGAHYTYAKVPLFDYIKDAFDLSRNNYDKIGHLAQGFFPALVIREVLLRTSPLRPGKWLFFLVVSVALAISAFYELIEWWAAVSMGGAADDFLGTQGYAWDTQSDMFLAMIGSILSQLCFKHYLDKRVLEIEEAD
jgi:putative membrane protein